MSGLFARFAACRRGAVAVELGLCAPFLIVVLYVLAEGGYMLSQANAVAKGLRAGAMYVARAPDAKGDDINAETRTSVENLVKRGTVDGVGDFQIPGWQTGTVAITRPGDYVTIGGVNVPIWEITASVPYTPLLSGTPTFTFKMSHAQAYIGQ